MVAKSHNISPLTPTQESELQKLAEQTPLEQAAKDISVKTVENRVKTGTATALFVLSMNVGTPAMATESPYEPLADGSGKTILVLKNSETAKIQADLFSAFDRNNKSEKREVFGKLQAEQQKKILSYYQMGKGEQPDEKELMKGLYNLLRLYENINIAKQGISEFNATGKEPSQAPMALEPMIKFIVGAFPSGKIFVDMNSVKQVDDMVGSVYTQIKEQAKQEKEQAKKKGKQLEENIKQLKSLLQAL